MELHSLLCPGCGAKLVEDENNINQYICKHCGAKVVLDGLDKNTMKAKVRLEEMKHAERMMKSLNEHEEHMHSEEIMKKERKAERKAREKKEEEKRAIIACLAIIGGLMVIGLIALGISKLWHRGLISDLKQIEAEIDEDIKNEEYESALEKAKKIEIDEDLTYDEKETWNDKKEEYIERLKKLIREQKATDPNYTYPPKSSGSLEDLTGEEAKEVLEKAGFNNIEMQMIPGSEFWGKENEVDRIVIDGNDDFSKNDLFRKDARIIIYYYEE